MATVIQPGSKTSAGSKVGFAFQAPPDNASTGEGADTLASMPPFGTDFAPLIALESSIGPIASFKDMPVELTGSAFPTEVYKDGELFGGRVTFIPRIISTLPWVLLGTVGWGSEGVNDPDHDEFYTYRFLPPWGGAGKDRSGATVTDPSTVTTPPPTTADYINYYQTLQYLFPDNASLTVDEKYLPWMQWAFELPDGNGTIGHDALINSLVLTVPQQGPVSAQLNIIGKYGKLYSSSDTVGKATFSSTTDDFSGIMMAADASITANGLEGASMYGARISILNNLTGPQEEQVVGSSYPETFTVKRRVVQIETTVKWKDANLARAMLSGSSTGSAYESTVASDGNFEIVLKSTKPIPTAASSVGHDDAKYSLTFKAPKVIWRPNGPILPDVRGDGMLTQDFVGIVADNGTDPYFYFDLYTTQNDSVYTDGSSKDHYVFYVKDHA